MDPWRIIKYDVLSFPNFMSEPIFLLGNIDLNQTTEDSIFKNRDFLCPFQKKIILTKIVASKRQVVGNTITFVHFFILNQSE